jgi:tetratricopeptide (TPR) repeat protein
MFKFMKSDPVKKAKKHVEKALIEIEEGYPEYASIEYEKAAKRFLEVEQTDFAVKYFREAAFYALEKGDHYRCAEMKILGAECLLNEGRYDEAGGLYSESSDHLYREKKAKEANRALGIAIIGYLAARNFDTATNITRKAEKRLKEGLSKKDALYSLAEMSVRILCEGEDIKKDTFENVARRVKPNECEQPLVTFVTESTLLAIDTEVVLEWAGAPQEEVKVKEPLELELRYKCPTEVRIVDHRLSLSNSVILTKEPEYSKNAVTEESWLIEFKPVLSGNGSIGPFTVTLEGDRVLVNKHSNKIEFRIARAPSQIALDVKPERVSCNLGEEAVIEVTVLNEGDGPAENIAFSAELSDGLEISLGNEEKLINFLGGGENVRFQIFVRAVGQGDELVTLKVVDGRSGTEVIKTSMVRIG